MENINNKIKAYAKANGVNEVDFQSDVILVKPSDEDTRIETWNLSITEPTVAQLNALETEANIIEQEETTAKTTKATNKTNAIAKLKASTWSPLTDDEATALFG